MTEIKGCPFCGAKPEIWQSSSGHNNRGQYTANFTIKCNKCNISITRESRFALEAGSAVFEANGYVECINAWNRRADNGTVC